MSDAREPSRARGCGACGALNGAGFDRCIRCGGALSPMAESIDRVRARLDGGSLGATKAIVALTLLVSALHLAIALKTGGAPDDVFFKGGDGIHAIRFGAAVIGVPLSELEPWRFFSAVFVHYGVIHLAFNLLAFASFGRTAEPAVGSARLLLAYVLTGVLGFATSAAYASLSGPAHPTAGSSGAVFGVMGMVLGVLLRRRDPRWKDFAVRAVLFSVLIGFAFNASSAGVRVNNAAHLGGLVPGVLIGLIYAGRGPRLDGHRRSDLLVNVAAALAALACIASLVLAQASPLWREIAAERERRGSQVPAPPRGGQPR